MENLITSVGDKGFSSIIEESAGSLNFLMQFRSTNSKATKKITETFRHIPKENLAKLPSLALESQVLIKYCPQCGYPLKKWIKKNKKLANELVEKHKNYVL